MVLIGAGQRGRIYADYIHTKGYARFAAVVEPNETRRNAAAAALDIPAENCFSSVEQLWEKGKLGEAAIIASMDQDHYTQVMRALDIGYHILLEKPISPSPVESMAIAGKAAETGLRVMVCHVLRYTPFFSAIKEVLDSGELGRVISIQHNENIGNYHMAHSFVRGNWRREELASPIIMQKSCHDMDILNWLTGSAPKRISSFGSLQHFTPQNAPEGAGNRCCECAAEPGCRFSAYKAYLPVAGEWPAVMVGVGQSEEEIREALKTSPYGNCVYHNDNDVCDTQVCLIEYENGVTVTFNMSAFTNVMDRTIKIMCEHGEIRGVDSKNEIQVIPFTSNARDAYNARTIHTQVPQGAHGGGDIGLVEDFIRVLAGGGESRSAVERSVDSHLMAYAAEVSRHGHTVVEIDELRGEMQKTL